MTAHATRNRDTERRTAQLMRAEVKRLRHELAAVDDRRERLDLELRVARRKLLDIGGIWPGIVYYTTWSGTPTGLIKIGWSENLPGRIQSLTWRGCRSELLAAEPAVDRSLALEYDRHEQFGHLRVTGTDGPPSGRTELFRDTPEIQAHMAGLRETYPDWLALCGF